MKLLVAIIVVFCAINISSSQHYNVKLVKGGLSGSGTTTRYWDCCKPSCAWKENLKKPTKPTDKPVASCSTDGSTVVLPSVQSSCIGGKSYMCSNQQPKQVNETFALGYVAASFTGGVDTNMCCACMLLTFHDALQGKQMLIQITNTGGDLGSNQFDIAIPGGGVGIFTLGCSTQWGTPNSGWGDQYGGVSSISGCNTLPKDLQPGCKFRFEFMQGASNPSVSFQQVECPSELVKVTGCNYS